jgi:hypothetical protein
MKKWIQKAIVQKTISYMPLSTKINYIFQKHVTKGVYLTEEYIIQRLELAKDHIDAYKNFSTKSIPISCLEIGTGWYPIVPISFFLIGSEKIYSVDISFLTNKERIKNTLIKFVELHEKDILSKYLENVIPERYNQLLATLQNFESLSLEEIIQSFNITYLVQDARHLSLEDNSIDLVNSNNTFEHIYPEFLIPILKDFKRVVNKEHGIMSHFIDMSDHFAHFDKSISIYNFLQFTESQWKWIDNSIQPQNRLRIDDYKKIYNDLQIPITYETNRPGNVSELEKIKLTKEFAKKPKGIVAVSHCHFISKMNN